MKDEVISAFAYKTGKAIEEMIDERTNYLEEHNRRLEGLILSYRQKIKGTAEEERFVDHFWLSAQ